MTVKISRRDDRIRLLFAVNEPFHCDEVDYVALHCVHGFTLAALVALFARVVCSKMIQCEVNRCKGRCTSSSSFYSG